MTSNKVAGNTYGKYKHAIVKTKNSDDKSFLRNTIHMVTSS